MQQSTEDQSLVNFTVAPGYGTMSHKNLVTAW
jgi:hypothetical protein